MSATEGNNGTGPILGIMEHTKSKFSFWGTEQFISVKQGNRYSLGAPQQCKHGLHCFPFCRNLLDIL